MKIIDIDEILEIIDTKFDEVISKTLNKNNAGWGDVCMFPNTRELFNLKIALINKVNTFKIIEEPKDEIEEIDIKILDTELFETSDTKYNILLEQIAYTQAIVSELIEQQNKIIKKINEK